MGYLLKTGVGLVLFFGAIVVFNLKLIELLEIGTCASGNTPFEISRPCPEGVGTDMLLLTGSIFAGLIGAAIFAFRGDPPWGRRRASAGFFGLGAMAWGIFFTATGATMLYTALNNDTVGEDGELGGMIVGVTFLVMGAPVLLFALWNSIKGLSSPRDESPVAAAGGMSGLGSMGGSSMKWGSASGGTASATGGGDAIGKIERLQKLRESGAINDAEFEREKAKVLAQQ